MGSDIPKIYNPPGVGCAKDGILFINHVLSLLSRETYRMFEVSP
jgi:hypothetical protein